MTYEENKITNKDHVATPRFVVEEIYKLIHIENYKMCWFPFNHHDSEFKLKADELKLKYKATHKFDNLGNDFFITDPPKNCNNLPTDLDFIILSSSVYAEEMKNELVKNGIEMGKIKSFVLLLPLSTLETPKRAELYSRYKEKLSIIIFKKRIKFLGKKTSFNTACCWICYNISGLPVLSWI